MSGSSRRAKTLARTVLFVSLGSLWHPAVSEAAESNAAATLKRDAARCLAHSSIDVCNDAIRHNPSDPQLLVALADAEVHAQRPANALRHYRRAAEIAPGMRGLTGKINATEARLHPKKPAAIVRREPKPAAAPDASVAVPAEAPTVAAAAETRYSNDAPVAGSH